MRPWCGINRRDVDMMKAELDTATNVVVVGAGYIGLEAASVLRKKDKHVTVLEMQGRVLARACGEPLSRFFEDDHRAHGAEIRLDTQVDCIDDRDGRASAVRLHDGHVLQRPTSSSLGSASSPPSSRSSPPARTAATASRSTSTAKRASPDRLRDYTATRAAPHARTSSTRTGKIVRLESIQNANDMGVIVAKSIIGSLADGERYDAIPWFWSNQYDLKLQTVGLFIDYDDIVVRGDPKTRKFSVVYLRGGKVIALDCVNHTKDYVQGKALIAKAHTVDKAKRARPDVLLKQLV